LFPQRWEVLRCWRSCSHWRRLPPWKVQCQRKHVIMHTMVRGLELVWCTWRHVCEYVGVEMGVGPGYGGPGGGVGGGGYAGTGGLYIYNR
jgi:hypothetical protein